MNELSTSERDRLLREMRRERSKRYADRIRVILHSDNGWPAERIAEALFIDPASVYRYRATYEAKGLDGLLSDNYVPKQSLLSKSQETELRDHLRGKVYLNAKSISQHVHHQYGILYSHRGMVTLLHRLGFSYRKPDPKPAQADSSLQAAFLQQLKKLRQELRPEDRLYFVDAAHPQMNAQLGYGWFETGTRVYLPSNATRTRVNTVALVDVDHQDVITRSFKTVDSGAVFKMVSLLENRHPKAKRIVVVSDNASYFRSAAVAARLERSRVDLVFLPPHSPNLNPTERLWKYLRRTVLHNTHYPGPTEFRNAWVTACRNLHRRWDQLGTLLTYRCHLYA